MLEVGGTCNEETQRSFRVLLPELKVNRQEEAAAVSDWNFSNAQGYHGETRCLSLIQQGSMRPRVFSALRGAQVTCGTRSEDS